MRSVPPPAAATTAAKTNASGSISRTRSRRRKNSSLRLEELAVEDEAPLARHHHEPPRGAGAVDPAKMRVDDPSLGARRHLLRPARERAVLARLGDEVVEQHEVHGFAARHGTLH